MFVQETEPCVAGNIISSAGKMGCSELKTM